MISNAWKWADEKPGRKRVSEIHGEEEICIVLKDSFAFMEEEGEEIGMEGGLEIEAINMHDMQHQCSLHHAHFHEFPQPYVDRSG